MLYINVKITSANNNFFPTKYISLSYNYSHNTGLSFIQTTGLLQQKHILKIITFDLNFYTKPSAWWYITLMFFFFCYKECLFHGFIHIRYNGNNINVLFVWTNTRKCFLGFSDLYINISCISCLLFNCAMRLLFVLFTGFCVI